MVAPKRHTSQSPHRCTPCDRKYPTSNRRSGTFGGTTDELWRPNIKRSVRCTCTRSRDPRDHSMRRGVVGDSSRSTHGSSANASSGNITEMILTYSTVPSLYKSPTPGSHLPRECDRSSNVENRTFDASQLDHGAELVGSSLKKGRSSDHPSGRVHGKHQTGAAATQKIVRPFGVEEEGSNDCDDQNKREGRLTLSNTTLASSKNTTVLSPMFDSRASLKSQLSKKST